MSDGLPEFQPTYAEGDTLPEIVMVLKDADLTDVTVTMHLEKPDGTILVKPATMVDAPKGKFKIEWVVGDLVAGMGQRAEVQFVTVGGDVGTSGLFLINVREELA